MIDSQIKLNGAARPGSSRPRLSSRQTGATLVEYAFIFIAFLTLLLGIMGFGHMLYVYHYVNHAAKEATRYASVRGSTCASDADGGSCQASNSASGTAGPTTSSDIKSFVSSMIYVGIDSSKLAVPTASATYFCGVSGSPCNSADLLPLAPTTCSTAANQPGCTVKVTVAYAYNFIFPLLPSRSTTTAPCTTAGFCLRSTAEMVIVH